MALIHRVIGDIPEDLPPGDYSMKIISAKWEGDDMVVTMSLDLSRPVDTALIKLQKREVKEDG